MTIDPFDLIKGAIEKNFEKVGLTLEDFEQILENANTPEGAVKLAEATLIAMGPEPMLAKQANPALTYAGLMGSNSPVEMGKGLMSMYLPFAIGAGAVGGAAADTANKEVESQNSKHDELRKNLAILQRVTKNLKLEHGLE